MRTKLTLVFVAFASVVSAQSTEEVILDFGRNPVQVRKLAQVVVEQNGYVVDKPSLQTIDAACNWQNKVDVNNLQQALRTILTPCGNVATMNDWKVIIRKTSQSPNRAVRSGSVVRATATIPPPEPEDEPDEPEVIPLPRSSQPASTTPPNPHIWSAEDLAKYGPLAPGMDPEDYRVEQQVMQANFSPAVLARHNAENAARQQFGYHNSRFSAGSGSYENYQYGYDPTYAHRAIQREIDASTWGGIEFRKVSKKFQKNVELWGCGERIIQAGEANNKFWDEVVSVPVHCKPLTYRYSDAEGRDWEVEIKEMIPPFRIQASKKITLDDNFFDRARVIRQMRRYVDVEQRDGTFRRHPR